MNLNPNCCGDRCQRAAGPVKLYPLGAGGNLILCSTCWAHENDYRRGRGDLEKWPTVDWASAEFYEPEETP